jgi:predicted permease
MKLPLWLRWRSNRELDEEIQAHLELEVQNNLTRGMTPEEARFAALRAFGNSTQVRERARENDLVTSAEGLLQDIRYSLRTLRRSLTFTLVVVLSLALGIGANTAIFSLIDAALLKMLPVRNPEQLVELKSLSPAIGLYELFSYAAFREFRGANPVLSGVLAFRELYNMDFEVDGHGGLANGQLVSGEYFSLLGVHAILGRTILPADEKAPGQSPVAVIGYDYWRQRFALDPDVVGKKIVLNNSPFTIIGVTPPEFFGLEPGARIDVSVPLSMVAQVRSDFASPGTPYDVFTAPFRNWLYVMARLKPGVTKERALASLEPIFARTMRESAEGLSGLPFDSPAVRRAFLATKLQLDSGGQGLATLRARFSKPLWIVMAVVALLLIVTCANIANLLLARGNSRQREIAVRLAIGAGRARLIRQLIAESILLGLGGGALGLVLAFWAGRSLLLLMSHSRSPILLNVHPDVTVLIFTLSISLLTALLFGMVPALRAARVDLRGSGKTNSRSRFGNALVVMQVAVSLVLVIGAGLLTRTLVNLKEFYPGFNQDNVLLFSVNPLMTGYREDQLVSLYERLLDHFKTIPGVRSATFSVHSPLSSGFSSSPLNVQGYKPPSDRELASVGVEAVGPEYFRTIQTAVLLGRDFTAADRAGGPKVAILNKTAAHFYFGEASPIGRRVNMPGYRGDPSWLEIVAVVDDAKYHDLREQAAPMVYIPLFQAPESGVTFEVRTGIDPASAAPALLNAIKATDNRLPVFAVKTLRTQLDDSLVQERLVASLSSAFGALALLLAGVGLYGLMAYAVNRRTNEIGIRMALGARPAEIAGMVLRETLLLVGLGLAIGIPASMIASRLIASELYGLKSSDGTTILLAILLLAGIAALAGYLPARRASRVDPMIALRYE